MNRAGELVEGVSAPIRAGWIKHYPVQISRPGAKCVIHVHAPCITARSIRSDMRFEPRSSRQAARFYDIYDEVLSSESVGERMAEILGDKRVVMPRNHGALIVTDSVAKACLDLYQLERACMYQLLATADGGEMALIPDDIAAQMGELAREGQNLEHFDGMRRWVDELQPD